MVGKVGIVFPTYNRKEFAVTALENLLENTTSFLVDRLLIVDGPSNDGLREALRKRISKPTRFPCELVTIEERHVVAGMLIAKKRLKTPLIAKIDSDTMVPPLWLEACLDAMRNHPEVWALGIEPRCPLAEATGARFGYVPDKLVGGIGLFRRECWANLQPRTPPYFGWSEHQLQSPWIKGWLKPSLKVFLLDALPFEPFHSLRLEYAKKGYQRIFGPVSKNNSHLWEWKFPDWRLRRPLK